MNAVDSALVPAGAMASAAAPRLRVGLLWHALASGNLGVVALTEADLALVATEAERLGARCDFVLLGGGATVPGALAAEWRARGHGLEARALRLLRPGFAARVGDCALVVDIGEGDSFATIYGFRRFFLYTLAKARVLAAGRPLLLAPQTIGPFDSALSRALARAVMRRARGVFARDTLSTALLQGMALGERADEAIDVAFALPYERRRHGPDGVVRVGLNVSGLLWSGGYTGDNQFGLAADYRATVTRLARAFVALPGVELHLVPHVIEPGRAVEDDVAAARALAAELPAGVPLVMAPAFTRPGEAKGYIAGLDFFAGARMHACIAAFSAGVPVVPMAYSRKFNGLFGTLGYTALADLKVADTEAAIAAVLSGFERRRALAAAVHDALGSVEARLDRYRQALARELAAALARHPAGDPR